MGKVMVTGALGNVGGFVAQYLIEQNQVVVAADISLEGLRARYGEGAECVYFDFTDPTTFDGVLKDVDRVFIMRPPHLGKPKDLEPFVEALKAKGGIRLVCFLSLIGIESNPIPPHYRIEKLIERAGLPYCHIGPSFFMQNISGIHAFEIKHFDRILVPVKGALTSFIDAEDVGEITARVLCEPERHLNRGYSITGPTAMDYHQVAAILSEVLTRKIAYANPKPSFAKAYWIQVRGIDKGYATVMGMLYLMTRLGTAKQVTSTFQEVVGKSPRSFKAFALKHLSAWQ